MGAEYFGEVIQEKLAIQTVKNLDAMLDKQSVLAGCLGGTTFAWSRTILQIEIWSHYDH